jgi:predicted transcriptional regulator
MQEKTTYTLQELYDDLPCTLVDLANKAGLNEVTVARIRDGKPTRRSTVNRLLLAMSDIYHRPLSLGNVTGVNVQVNKRQQNAEAA